MVRKFSPTVERLIENKMASGKYASENELLVEALESLDVEEEELRAIQASLDSVDRGEDGVALDDAFRKLRQKYNIPSCE